MPQAPEWFESHVIDGLNALLVLRLPRAPAADTINAVCDVWLTAMMAWGITWTEALDARRLRHAFVALAGSATEWPSPASLRNVMPFREPQQALPPPRSRTVSPAVREQIDGLVRRQRRTADEINHHHLLTELAKHIGAANGAGAEQLARALQTTPRHIRVLVTELRMDGEHVCGTPAEGYFMAETEADITATCDFLKGRAFKSLLLASRMAKVSIPDLVGQMKLPT